MNIASIQFPVFNPYNDSAIEIYVSGCTNYCEGCHNPELHDFSFGRELDRKELIDYLLNRRDLFEIISILGGDLLCQDEAEAISLMWNLRFFFKDKKFWLFTGKETFPDWCLDYFDIIKYGPFIPSLETNTFPSSSNQKIFHNKLDK